MKMVKVIKQPMKSSGNGPKDQQRDIYSKNIKKKISKKGKICGI